MQRKGMTLRRGQIFLQLFLFFCHETNFNHLYTYSKWAVIKTVGIFKHVPIKNL